MQKFLQVSKKSFESYKVDNARDLWAKAVADGYTALSCELPTAFEKVITKNEDGSDNVKYTMVFSTPDVDRHGDIVVQNWDVKSYLSNPVILDSHNYGSITEILARAVNVRMETGVLKGELEFALMNPKGKLAKDLVDNGFLNASSVGFIPKNFDEQGRITESELLEVSLVSVPANAYALFEKKIKETNEEIVSIAKEINVDSPTDTVISAVEKIDTKKLLLKNIHQCLKDMESISADSREKAILADVGLVISEMNRKSDSLDEKTRSVFKALRSLQNLK
jgi:HK97 family phage prohead protease